MARHSLLTPDDPVIYDASPLPWREPEASPQRVTHRNASGKSTVQISAAIVRAAPSDGTALTAPIARNALPGARPRASQPRDGPAAALALCCGWAYAYGLLIAAQSLMMTVSPRPSVGTIRVVSLPRPDRPPLDLTSLAAATPLLRLPLEMPAPPQLDLEEALLPQTQWIAVTQSADGSPAEPTAPGAAGYAEIVQDPSQVNQLPGDVSPANSPDRKFAALPEIPGGRTLVAAVLIDADGRAVQARIMVPSDHPGEDQKYIIAVTGSLLGKPSPPLAPGETRWVEFRVTHDADRNSMMAE